MNKLIQEQLQKIEERLRVKYDLKYEEIRNELLDHIACEIEHLMNEGETFNEATTLIFRKWNVRLISDGKGIYRGIPHFIVNQLNAEFRKVELKLLVLSVIICVFLILGEQYLNINKVLLLGSLFVVNGIGIYVMFKELNGLKDYRLEFFKSKGLLILFKMGVALLGVFIYHFTWGKTANTFSFEMLIAFYFLVNTFLLLRFRSYSKYQKFKIVKRK